MKQSSLRSVYTALFAALISVGAIVTIPIGPVPIVLQNAFAILAGLLLGPLQGAGAVGLFLLAGALGLPVFSGGNGGFAVLAGPTGGYLVGYFIGALVAGYAVRRASKTNALEAVPVVLSAAIAGFACIYIPGVLGLRKALGIDLAQAILKGVVPFLFADAIKIAIIVPIALKVRPVIERNLNPDA